MVGGDDRIRTVFIESVKTTLVEMERYAAVMPGEKFHSRQINLEWKDYRSVSIM